MSQWCTLCRDDEQPGYYCPECGVVGVDDLSAQFLTLAASDTEGYRNRRAYYARAAIRRGSSAEGIAGLYGVPVEDVQAMLREDDSGENPNDQA